MNLISLFQAASNLNYDNSFTIENDGQMWHGTDEERIYLTVTQIKAITDKAAEAEADKAASKQAVLTKLGLTADEVTALLG